MTEIPEFLPRFRRIFALLGALGLAYGCARDAVARDAVAKDAVARRTLERTERIDETRLDVSIRPGRLAVDPTTLSHLIGDSARAIATYYGRLPFARARVVVTPTSGGIHGTTFCTGEGLVRLELGAQVGAADIKQDWIITHELLHVAFPSFEDDKYRWVGEGLSSYVEPLVRVRAGTLSNEEAWRGLLEGAPRGLPEASDQGLDNTHTWGRTYWGGALFWFEVDLLTRERSHNQRSIRDILRAIGAAGAHVCVDLPMDRLLAIGDAATGTHVLSEVYAKRALTNSAPEIEAWWSKLGVALHAGSVVFDDSAPWANIRKSMTRD